MSKLDSMELMQGTLDMLILRILVSGKKHGLDISKTILLLSNESLQVGHGSMYPALHRLERRGFTKSTREITEKGRTAKYYELTPLGREQVESEKEQWKAFVAVIDNILDNA